MRSLIDALGLLMTSLSDLSFDKDEGTGGNEVRY